MKNLSKNKPCCLQSPIIQKFSFTIKSLFTSAKEIKEACFYKLYFEEMQ